MNTWELFIIFVLGGISLRCSCGWYLSRPEEFQAKFELAVGQVLMAIVTVICIITLLVLGCIWMLRMLP